MSDSTLRSHERKRKKAPPKPRRGPVPLGLMPRLVKLLPEEWAALDRIAAERGLGDKRGGRTAAIRVLIREANPSGPVLIGYCGVSAAKRRERRAK